MAESLSKDMQASGGVVIGNKENLCVLYCQSGFMAELFPEIVLIDGTYNVIKAGMPLYSFMTEDGFGSGGVSLCAALAEESAECLEVIIHSFKEVNPTSNEIQVIL